jgi:hypothetical protein
MSLAIKLLGVTALCVLCCALPAILVATVGLFQIFGLTWGVVGVIGSLIGIAALSMFASRFRAKGTSNSCSCSPTCANDPVPELTAPPDCMHSFIRRVPRTGEVDPQAGSTIFTFIAPDAANPASRL